MALSSIQLEAFYAVAQARSFTKASAQLHITQSALSQRVLNLEQELGTSLFVRDRAGLRLTETAQDLVRFCQTKSELESDFLSRLKSKDTLAGIIRVAGFSSVMRSVIMSSLAPLLSKNSSLQLIMLTREMDELMRLLKSGEADFIVTEEKYNRDEIVSVHLGTEINVLVEAKDYEGPEIYLDHDEKDTITARYLKRAGIKSSRVERRYLDDVYGLLDGVKMRMGRAVLPRHLLTQEKGLRILHPQTSLETEVYLNYFRQPFYSKLHSLIVGALGSIKQF